MLNVSLNKTFPFLLIHFLIESYFYIFLYISLFEFVNVTETAVFCVFVWLANSLQQISFYPMSLNLICFSNLSCQVAYKYNESIFISYCITSMSFGLFVKN